MKEKIKHIFFDLDRTLWDFDRNTREALYELCEKYNLFNTGVTDFEDFYTVFNDKNDFCWQLYRENRMTKNHLRIARFRMVMKHYGYTPDGMARKFAKDFLQLSPTKTGMFDGAVDALKYLNERYKLHIITNGFEEVQHIKLKSAGIDHFFEHIITSERAGHKKPDERIFAFAMKLSNAAAEESLMVGDDPNVDIIGAYAAGMHTILFDPNEKFAQGKATHRITHLEELLQLL